MPRLPVMADPTARDGRPAAVPKPWLGSWAPNGLWSSRLTSFALLICQVWEGFQRRWKSSSLVGWKMLTYPRMRCRGLYLWWSVYRQLHHVSLALGHFFPPHMDLDTSISLSPITHMFVSLLFSGQYGTTILWGLILNLCCLNPGIWLVNVWELAPTLTISSVTPPLEPVI